MITKAEREKDKAICEAATKGPWRDAGYQHGDDAGPHVEDQEERKVAVCQTSVAEHRANGRFIARAREALPAYIADADEMERRVTKVEKLLAQAQEGAMGARGAGMVILALEHEERASLYSKVLCILRGVL